MTGEECVKILIVDDHDVVRVGLRSLLDRRGRYRVVGEAASVAGAVRAASDQQVDVVIMDIRLPDGNGIEACREIRAKQPATRVLMLTSYADDSALFASIMAGAAGYVLKQTRSKALIEAIDVIADGGSLLDPLVTQKVLERVRDAAVRASSKGESALSEQEERVLSLVAEGKTNREIADALFLTQGTVKNYVHKIMAKLNLSRRAQLAAHVVRIQQTPRDKFE